METSLKGKVREVMNEFVGEILQSAPPPIFRPESHSMRRIYYLTDFEFTEDKFYSGLAARQELTYENWYTMLAKL